MVTEMTTEAELAKAARELREHLGLTQIDFAKRLKVGLSTVQRIEDESRGPTWENLKQLLGIAMDAGRRDLVQLFVRTFRREWGPILTESTPQEKGTTEEERWVAIFRDVLRSDPALAASLTGWLELFERNRGARKRR